MQTGLGPIPIPRPEQPELGQSLSRGLNGNSISQAPTNLATIKDDCANVISLKEDKISSRKIASRITKAFSITSILATIASTLFIVLAQTTTLTLTISALVLSIALLALLISTLYSLANSSDTLRDNCQLFIANMIKDTPFEHLSQYPDGMKTLNEIINTSLKDTIPINTEPFVNLKLLNKTYLDENKEKLNKNAQLYTSELVYNFIKILTAQNIAVCSAYFLEKDLNNYISTLNLQDIMKLANLPLRELQPTEIKAE